MHEKEHHIMNKPHLIDHVMITCNVQFNRIIFTQYRVIFCLFSADNLACIYWVIWQPAEISYLLPSSVIWQHLAGYLFIRFSHSWIINHNMEMCFQTLPATDPSVVNYHIIHISGGNKMFTDYWDMRLNMYHNFA